MERDVSGLVFPSETQRRRRARFIHQVSSNSNRVPATYQPLGHASICAAARTNGSGLEEENGGDTRSQIPECLWRAGTSVCSQPLLPADWQDGRAAQGDSPAAWSALSAACCRGCTWAWLVFPPLGPCGGGCWCAEKSRSRAERRWVAPAGWNCNGKQKYWQIRWLVLCFSGISRSPNYYYSIIEIILTG